MASPCAPDFAQTADLSEHLRSVLEAKIASAQKACGTLAQHKEPDGLAEAIIEYEVAASLKDPAEARALNYEYQERFKKFLERPEGSEAEETIATATQALLNVIDCINRLENSIRLRSSANWVVEAEACASVSTYLTQLYHATRDELEGAVADESATGVPASGKKGRAARWQPVANPPSLPELSEDVEAEATGQVGAVEG